MSEFKGTVLTFQPVQAVVGQIVQAEELTRPGSRLQELLDRPPTLAGRATEQADGRLIPVVLAIVRDRRGGSRPGLLVRLRHDEQLVDHSRTDGRGIVLLRFPRPRREHAAVSGLVELVGPTTGPVQQDVTVPADTQHSVVEIVLDELPAPPRNAHTPVRGERGRGRGSGVSGGNPGRGGGAAASHSGDDEAQAAGEASEEVAGGADDVREGTEDLIDEVLDGEEPSGDDPVERLPTDFTTELCSDVTRLLGSTPDPILGAVAEAGDFRGRRTPLIKRMTVPRVGHPEGDGEPRRYLVRLRQEWIFLGYTLGELAEVDTRDPGEIIGELQRTVTREVDRSLREANRLTQDVRSTVRRNLSQLSSIDTVLDVAKDVETTVGTQGFGGVERSGSFGWLGAAAGAVAGGLLGGPAGAVVGGGLGGLLTGDQGVSANVGTSTTTSVRASTLSKASKNTSLEVNSLLHTATSRVNQSIRTVASSAQEVAQTLTKTTDQVSPLLSRVTNLLRWTLYENYAVCTAVEDIVEVEPVPVVDDLGESDDPDDPETRLFSDEAIVEYRRIFEPALLEPRLAPHFETLRQALAQKRQAQLPISRMTVRLDYAATGVGADVTMRLVGNGDAETPEIRLELDPDSTRAWGYVHLTPPLDVNEINEGYQLELSLELNVQRATGWLDFWDSWSALLDQGKVRISRLQVSYEAMPGVARRQSRFLDTGFGVDRENPNDSKSFDAVVPQPATNTDYDPLVLHINANRYYYFGRLVQAALDEPSLRDDARRFFSDFEAFDSQHPLWQLPIIDLEGHRLLVIRDIDAEDEDAADVLADEGSATVVQLAAPGAYAEALQGLLELTDAVGRIHPALEPPQAPVVAPLGHADLTQFLSGGGNSAGS